jgi:two-component system, cell cycle sensor histidine kinase and response regulator CckA
VFLPLNRQEEVAAKPAPGPAELVEGGSATVLLVEDEDRVRAASARMLRNAGYRVLEAANGVEALSVLAAARGIVELVLSDVVMPQMSGHLLFEALRRDYPEIRILFLSGYSDHALLRREGMRDELRFLQKPYTREALLAKVRQALR